MKNSEINCDEIMPKMFKKIFSDKLMVYIFGQKKRKEKMEMSSSLMYLGNYI